MSADLRCAVNPSRPATLDAEHVAWVNHEAYYFSTRAAKRRFGRHPAYWCDTVTDPVTLERFRPRGDEPVAYHRGRPYFFLTEESRSAFVADPEP
ncbi:MAG TPA: hypothetical protein VKU85_10775, partial [bacterium]|nr:hypothetical protein [bacterium]